MGRTEKNIVINEKLEIKETTFGKCITIGDGFVDEIAKIMKNYSGIIIMRNKGRGFKPFKLLLKHQLYIETLEKDLEKYNDTTSYTLVPVNSEHYIDVAKIEHEYIPDDIDELMKKKEESINEVRYETEDAISDLNCDMSYEISEITKRFDEKIEKAKEENKEKE